MKKRTKIILGVVLLLLVLCLAPFPQRVSLKADCWLLNGTDASGLGSPSSTIEIDGWYLRFLLLEDRLLGTVSVTSPEEPAMDGVYTVESTTFYHFSNGMQFSGCSLCFFDTQYHFAELNFRSGFSELFFTAHDASSDTALLYCETGSADHSFFVEHLSTWLHD